MNGGCEHIPPSRTSDVCDSDVAGRESTGPLRSARKNIQGVDSNKVKAWASGAVGGGGRGAVRCGARLLVLLACESRDRSRLRSEVSAGTTSAKPRGMPAAPLRLSRLVIELEPTSALRRTGDEREHVGEVWAVRVECGSVRVERERRSRWAKG